MKNKEILEEINEMTVSQIILFCIDNEIDFIEIEKIIHSKKIEENDKRIQKINFVKDRVCKNLSISHRFFLILFPFTQI